MSKESLERKIARRNKLLDNQLGRWIANLDKFLFSELEQIFGKVAVTTDNAFILINNIQGTLERNGLDQLLAETTEFYKDKAQYIKDDYAKYVPAGSFYSDADRLVIAEQIRVNSLAIKKTLDLYTTRVMQQALAGTLSQEVIDYAKIHDRAGNALLNEVETALQTQVDGFERGLGYLKTEKLGLNHFLYAGNVIKTTRPFCLERVGKVFTRAELLSWDNGQGISPTISLGGWNCRHHISWITLETAKEEYGYSGK